MEESHYYPFGLIQAGISSKALEFGNPENKYKYNGIEYEKDLGLEVYDAQLRELDGQIGRWWQIDPKTEDMEMWSPYASNYNNPIRYSDPLGDEGQACCGSLGTRLWGGVKALGGMLEMAAGAAGGVLTSWTGVGAVVGGAAVVHGADNTAAGFTQLFTGKDTKTFTEQGISKGLQAAGVSEQTANTAAGYIDGGIGMALTVGAGAIPNTPKVKVGADAGKAEVIQEAGAESSKVLLNTPRQLQAKFKHAADFGVAGNYSKANAGNFSSAINQHINSEGVQLINGTYRGQSVIHHLNPNTGLNVMSNTSSQFISGWKLNPAQLQNVLNHGGL